MAPALQKFDSLPDLDAPDSGQLTSDMLQAFDSAGVIILRDFCAVEECDKLRDRSAELVDAFDPSTLRSVFSTTKQTQLDDDYFISSGDKIRFFLGDDVFESSGELRQSKHNSLNKRCNCSTNPSARGRRRRRATRSWLRVSARL